MRRLFAVALFAAAVAARAGARPVTVQVTSTACKAATLRAMPSSGDPIDRRWSGSDVSFDLPDGRWTITAAAADCWAAPVVADAANINVKLWPVATLRFRVEEPRDATVQVLVSSADGQIAPSAADCARKGALHTCNVPATALDVRISADGLVPQYLFDREAAPRARVDLGAIRLARGASVSGRVSLPQKDPKLENISVQLAPSSMLTGSVDPVRAALVSQTVKTNRRGFFQFAGVDEGTYTVVAKAEGWSPAIATDIHVAAGAEVALPKRLELAALAQLEVVVDPPTDFGGKPWRINLVRTWPVSAEPAQPLRAAFSPAGAWTGKRIEAGRYNLAIEDAAGSTFHREFIDVGGDAAPVRVTIDAFRVGGRVTFRGDPVEAGIWFTHPLNQTASIRIRSDKEGKYETIFTDEGNWWAQIALPANNIRLMNLDVHRRADGAPVELDLELPRGRVRGTAVGDDGKLVQASVKVLAKERPTGSAFARDGTFDLIGIDVGDVMVRAYNADGDSGLVPVHVTEAADEPVTLRVPKRRKAKMWVVNAAGQPVAGALVRYMSAGNFNEEVTGPGGELTLPLPQSETSIPMLILSPGLPRKMLMLPVGAEPAEVVISPASARLLLQHTPRSYFVVHDGALFSGHSLLWPSYGGRPREATSAGLLVDIEPGTYSFCSAPQRCKSFVLQAGTTTSIDVEATVR